MNDAGARPVNEALEILERLELPKAQRNQRSAMTLLALADILPGQGWSDAEAPLRGVTEMMDWIADGYGKAYAPNTRETIRRQTIHQFVAHGLLVENPDEPARPINSPNWCYQLSNEFLQILREFGEPGFDAKVSTFLDGRRSGLKQRHRDLPREEVRLPDGGQIELSAGGQNRLIRTIVEEFAPRFLRSPRVLHLGDAANKRVHSDAASLGRLGIHLPERGKDPDVLIHDGERDWLVVVEAVTSHGPVDQKRKSELSRIFARARPGLVFVTAFPDRETFARFHSTIAWESEVWIASEPDHLIHFDGERFLGPYWNGESE